MEKISSLKIQQIFFHEIKDLWALGTFGAEFLLTFQWKKSSKTFEIFLHQFKKMNENFLPKNFLCEIFCTRNPPWYILFMYKWIHFRACLPDDCCILLWAWMALLSPVCYYFKSIIICISFNSPSGHIIANICSNWSSGVHINFKIIFSNISEKEKDSRFFKNHYIFWI